MPKYIFIVLGCGLLFLSGCSSFKQFMGYHQGYVHGVYRCDNLGRVPFSLAVPDLKEDQKPVPLILAFHYSGGDSESYLEIWETEARKRHIAVVAPLRVGDYPIEVYLSFIDFVIQKYQLDGSNVFLAGTSSGAVVARKLLMLEPKRWKGTVLVSSSTNENWVQNIASNEKLPPVLFVHGELDQQYDYKKIQEFANNLKLNGIEVETYFDDEADHSHPERWNDIIFTWIEKHLSNPPRLNPS